MKKTNYIRKITTYFVLCCLSLSSFLFYVPGTTVLSAPGDPILEVLTPEEGTELDQAVVIFTGRISDDLSPPEKITFNVFEILAGTEEPLDITDTGDYEIVNNTESGNWMFTREFSKGSHTVLFRIEDEDSNRTEVKFSFTVNQSVIIPSEDSGNSNTHEATNTTETIAVETDNESENTTEVETLSEVKEEEIELTPVSRPLVASLNILRNGVENPKDILPAEDMTNVPVNAAIELVIKENGELNYKDEPLIITSEKGTTIKSTENSTGQSPEKKDGEYRITFTPTANLQYSTTYYVFVNPAITNDQNGRIYQRYIKFTTAPVAPSHEIHGNFGNNTNSCANCHSTHNGNDEKLLGGKYGSDTTKNLCMSCHDGTNGAPMPDHYNAKNQHFNYTDGLEATYSCTSCHNPHTGWTEENPNKLKGHPETTYKKQGTAKGISTDFSLCLKCHDGGKAVNIKKYYEEEALLAESGHKITAEDGTSLNGQLTCADCHETHGSDNLKLLKENLGNAPLAAKDKFKTVGTEWTVENERNFCLKCHNGNTELYGKNPVFDDQTESHQDTAKSCSSCHGAGKDIKEQMRSAAHAPKRFIVEATEETANQETKGNSDADATSTPQPPEEAAIPGVEANTLR